MEVITLGSVSQSGDILRAPLINSHSSLTLTPYWRGLNFVADNLASFASFVALDGVKLDTPHRLDGTLSRKPNQYQTAFAFFRRLYFDSVHTHNGYAFIARPKFNPDDPSPLDAYAGGNITGLYNLESYDVTPFRLYDATGDITTGSLWYWHAPSKRAISSADIIHIKGSASGCDDLAALNPSSLHWQTFETALLIQSRIARAMRRGTNIIGAIEIPDGASDEQTNEIVDTLKKFRSPNSESDMLVLKGGAKLNNQALNPQQLQLIEQEKAATKRLAEVLGVDPVYLYERSETQYSNNAEQAGDDVTRFTFRIWIENIEAELTTKLLTEAEQDQGLTIELNPDALLRGSTEVQSAVVTELVNGGIATPNEGRKELGLAPQTEADSDKLREPHAVASAPTSTGGTDATA